MASKSFLDISPPDKISRIEYSRRHFEDLMFNSESGIQGRIKICERKDIDMVLDEGVQDLTEKHQDSQKSLAVKDPIWFQSLHTYDDDDDDDSDDATVYIVTLRQAPASHYDDHLTKLSNHFRPGAFGSGRRTRLHKPRHQNVTNTNRRHGFNIAQVHDSLLKRVFKGEKYLKLYSYHHLINGFAGLVTQQQAEKLSRRREVSNVVLDFWVRTATTHTPQFLGLPQGAWFQSGGFETAGEGITIAFVDTGIDPTHPSFADDKSEHPLNVPAQFSGICEVTQDFPSGSCNRKLVGARHFAASAIIRGMFNSTEDYASPFDGDGHGTDCFWPAFWKC